MGNQENANGVELNCNGTFQVPVHQINFELVLRLFPIDIEAQLVLLVSNRVLSCSSK